ncbi:6PGL phosphogluconolactonase, partial [Geococcyx californianus]|nr:6PGL phosphogluconolactonase [Geococcyx californianus]
AALAALVAERAASAGPEGFSLALSGGSLVEILARSLPAAVAGTDTSRWLLALCDERLVPPGHPESTGGAYRVRGHRG